jgi:hypothetical protein
MLFCRGFEAAPDPNMCQRHAMTASNFLPAKLLPLPLGNVYRLLTSGELPLPW